MRLWFLCYILCCFCLACGNRRARRDLSGASVNAKDTYISSKPIIINNPQKRLVTFNGSLHLLHQLTSLSSFIASHFPLFSELVYQRFKSLYRMYRQRRPNTKCLVNFRADSTESDSKVFKRLVMPGLTFSQLTISN